MPAKRPSTPTKLAPKPNQRWRAVIHYLDGSFSEYQFDEFIELGTIIEDGPDYTLISSIHIEYALRQRIGELSHNLGAIGAIK